MLSAARQKAAAAALKAEKDRASKELEKNAYSGGMDMLISAAKTAQAKAWGEEWKFGSHMAEENAATAVVTAYEKALQELDELGLLEPMAEMFGDIGSIAQECAGNVELIIAR